MLENIFPVKWKLLTKKSILLTIMNLKPNDWISFEYFPLKVGWNIPRGMEICVCINDQSWTETTCED